MISVHVRAGSGRLRGQRDVVFTCRVEWGGEVHPFASHQPLLDGCRLALELGADPEDMAVMVWMPSGRESLRARVGEAAKLRVVEDDNGIRFRPFEASPFPAEPGVD